MNVRIIALLLLLVFRFSQKSEAIGGKAGEVMSMKNSVATHSYSISDEIAAMQTLASAGLAIHPERCVRLRNRHASCDRCAQACTSGAITISDGAWNLDPSLCVQCGTCATVCPVCALEAAHPHDAELLQKACSNAQKIDNLAVFACSEALREQQGHVQKSSVVETTCLSRLDETLIFSLHSQGVKEIYAVHGTCDGCPRAQGCKSIRLVEKTVASIAQAWNIQAFYHTTSLFPNQVLGKNTHGTAKESQPLQQQQQQKQEQQQVQQQQQELRDRCCLSNAATLGVCEQGKIHATIKPTHVQKDGTLPHFVPLRRRKLLDLLAQWGKPVQSVIDTRLWGHVTIDFQRCKSCKMCAVFCPTGALSRYSTQEESGIEHYVAECVHCCLCQDICPAHAITCVTQVPAMQLALGTTERYAMPDPDWASGPNQILLRMKEKISGNSVEHSY